MLSGVSRPCHQCLPIRRWKTSTCCYIQRCYLANCAAPKPAKAARSVVGSLTVHRLPRRCSAVRFTWRRPATAQSMRTAARGAPAAAAGAASRCWSAPTRRSPLRRPASPSDFWTRCAALVGVTTTSQCRQVCGRIAASVLGGMSSARRAHRSVQSCLTSPPWLCTMQLRAGDRPELIVAQHVMNPNDMMQS